MRNTYLPYCFHHPALEQRVTTIGRTSHSLASGSARGARRHLAWPRQPAPSNRNGPRPAHRAGRGPLATSQVYVRADAHRGGALPWPEGHEFKRRGCRTTGRGHLPCAPPTPATGRGARAWRAASALPGRRRSRRIWRPRPSACVHARACRLRSPHPGD